MVRRYSKPWSLQVVRRAIFLAALIGLVTAGHILTGQASNVEHAIHVLLRVGYLIPILFAALWYGTRGAASVVIVVTLLFGLHVGTAWSGVWWENANQFAMIGVYWVGAVVTGGLVDLERRAVRMRRRAEMHTQREVLIHGLAGLEAALKSRDEYEAAHGDTVSALAVDMARELRLPQASAELVRLAGLVHDLGKIGIRDDVLFKPGALSAEELARMRRHPAIAASILAAIPGAQDVARIVAAHHEYLDGSGYPAGLSGPEIPIETRIVTVADAFCALTEDRVYHRGLSLAAALRLLESWCPRRLAPDIVAALRHCILSDGLPRVAAPTEQAHQLAV